MLLVKYLQNEIAPARAPWFPHGDGKVRRFINDIVLEEEHDEDLPLADGTTTYTSHFELYMKSMEEVSIGSRVISNNLLTRSRSTLWTSPLPRSPPPNLPKPL